MADKYNIAKAKRKIIISLIVFAAMLAVGYITVWISLHMAQLLSIRIIIGAAGPLWAIITIWVMWVRMDLTEQIHRVRSDQRRTKRKEEFYSNEEYMELKKKYPMAIHRHEQHCQHHKIRPEEAIEMALHVTEEEWAERERFRREAREERHKYDSPENRKHL